MKKLSIAILAILCISCEPKSDSLNTDLQIVPKPSSVILEKTSDNFVWNDATSIVVNNSCDTLFETAKYLQGILNNATGRNVELEREGKSTSNVIIMSIDATIEGSESYQLTINKQNIELKASTNQGIFFGMQSLLQLMPAEVYKKDGLAKGFDIRAVKVEDTPRFSYRGMHLDVSRNFTTKDNVKKYIDLLAMYKFNRFHWHLTDGAGWRIEIKKYPLLTKKTAFRKQSTWKEFWNEGGRKFVDEGTPDVYGGYYTQDDIREVVAYAQSKFITIVPEIEMPGHSEEVFVAYPELSCSGIPYKNSDFCAGNDQSFQFIEDVLTEVMELFPSKYIHIGGDEAGKEAWRTCPKCKKRQATENLKNVDELQSYFVKRVSQFLNSKGRSLIGWDEIVEGGLAKDATVMLWRDRETAIKAAKDGHEVIMTPGSHCYFDFYQADPMTEVEAIGGYTPLRKVYSFEVVPDESLAQFFIGGQANLWAEYIPTYEHVEYMVMPRMIALSEALWSSKENRNWDDFKLRLQNQLPRLDYLGINYHKPTYELELMTKLDEVNKQVLVYFEHEQSQPTIRYTLDGTTPTDSSPLYEDTIRIGKPCTVTASIMKDGKAVKEYKRNLGYHLGIGKKVTYNKKWTSYPAGGETALVDGLFGGVTYGDGMWQGFTSDMDVVIDLEESTAINHFEARFMQLIGPGVYMPHYVEVLISEDGKTFESIAKMENDVDKMHDRLCFKDFAANFENKKARYVKIFAKNQIGFLFTDEIVLY